MEPAHTPPNLSQLDGSDVGKTTGDVVAWFREMNENQRRLEELEANLKRVKNKYRRDWKEEYLFTIPELSKVFKKVVSQRMKVEEVEARGGMFAEAFQHSRRFKSMEKGEPGMSAVAGGLSREKECVEEMEVGKAPSSCESASLPPAQQAPAQQTPESVDIESESEDGMVKEIKNLESPGSYQNVAVVEKMVEETSIPGGVRRGLSAAVKMVSAMVAGHNLKKIKKKFGSGLDVNAASGPLSEMTEVKAGGKMVKDGSQSVQDARKKTGSGFLEASSDFDGLGKAFANVLPLPGELCVPAESAAVGGAKRHAEASLQAVGSSPVGPLAAAAVRSGGTNVTEPCSGGELLSRATGSDVMDVLPVTQAAAADSVYMEGGGEESGAGSSSGEPEKVLVEQEGASNAASAVLPTTKMAESGQKEGKVQGGDCMDAGPIRKAGGGTVSPAQRSEPHVAKETITQAIVQTQAAEKPVNESPVVPNSLSQCMKQMEVEGAAFKEPQSAVKPKMQS